MRRIEQLHIYYTFVVVSTTSWYSQNTFRVHICSWSYRWHGRTLLPRNILNVLHLNRSLFHRFRFCLFRRLKESSRRKCLGSFFWKVGLLWDWVMLFGWVRKLGRFLILLWLRIFGSCIWRMVWSCWLSNSRSNGEVRPESRRKYHRQRL